MSARDLFLCHAHADKETIVRPLAAELRRYGVTYWLDEAEITLGESITAKISEGLVSSSYIVVCITPAFLSRNWPQRELQSAIGREASLNRVVVLPIVAVSEEDIWQRLPLLADRLYIRWGEAREVARTLAHRVGKTPDENVTHFLPAEHSGQIWISFLQSTDDVGKPHRYRLQWGPWLAIGEFTSEAAVICLVTNKGVDVAPVPLMVHVSPPCNVRTGVTDAPCPISVDINFQWQRMSESS